MTQVHDRRLIIDRTAGHVSTPIYATEAYLAYYAYAMTRTRLCRLPSMADFRYEMATATRGEALRPLCIRPWFPETNSRTTFCTRSGNSEPTIRTTVSIGAGPLVLLPSSPVARAPRLHRLAPPGRLAPPVRFPGPSDRPVLAILRSSLRTTERHLLVFPAVAMLVTLQACLNLLPSPFSSIFPPFPT